MKRVLLVGVVLCAGIGANAQTWDEWFNQEKTQLTYLKEQLVALKQYGDVVKKGYEWVHGGLARIGQQKGDDILLHREHFASLRLVKRGLKEMASLQAFDLWGQQVRSTCNICRGLLSKTVEFTGAERAYFEEVLHRVVADCSSMEEEAVVLLKDDTYQLTDDERLSRLQALAEEMQDLYGFTRHFASRIAGAALDRKKEQNDAARLKSLY